MIYPKISQRYLAMVVLCLLLTLGAVGVSFLIYFFNKPFVLNTVHGKSERFEILLPQRISMSKNNIERDKKIQSHNDSDGNKIESVGSFQPLEISTKFSMMKHSKIPALYRAANDYDVSTAEKKFQKEADADQQNIYIDEFDKPIMQVVDRLNPPFKYLSSDDLTSTDSSVDHNLAEDKSRLSNPQGATNNNIIPVPRTDFQELDPKEPKQTHQFTNLDQVFDNDKKNIYENHSNDDDDNTDSGSGSGDFDFKVASYKNNIDIYDDGTTNFIRRISLKMSRTIGHKENSKRSRKIKPVTVRDNNKRKRLKALQFRHTIDSANMENDSTEELYQLKSFSSSIQKRPVLNLHKSLNGANNNLEASTLKKTRTTPAIAIWESGPPTTNYFSYNQGLSQLQQRPQSIISKSPPTTWLETRTRRIIGNVKKSEERSRQLLLCEKEEAGGGELCRMLFKGHLND